MRLNAFASGKQDSRAHWHWLRLVDTDVAALLTTVPADCFDGNRTPVNYVQCQDKGRSQNQPAVWAGRKGTLGSKAQCRQRLPLCQHNALSRRGMSFLNTQAHKTEAAANYVCLRAVRILP